MPNVNVPAKIQKTEPKIGVPAKGLGKVENETQNPPTRRVSTTESDPDPESNLYPDPELNPDPEPDPDPIQIRFRSESRS